MRTRSKKAKRCPLCGGRMKKNGGTAAGAQRWKCPECDAGMVAPSVSARRLRQLEGFVAWLRGGHSLREQGRSFRRHTAWCRRVEPLIAQPPSKRHVLMTDGTYAAGRCLLVLMDGDTGEVVKCRWCEHETTAAYRALFHGVPAPDALVSDGMRGMGKAARAEWPDARLQRCLVHVQRDTRRDLTTRPQGQAGRELRKLSLKLTKIKTAEQASQWAQAPDAWHERRRSLVNERSTAKSDPHHPKARRSRSWWWTHERLRRAYTRMEKLFRNGQLFACLDPRLLEGGPVPGTTNRLEGGVNSPIKRVLSNHRGMIQAHMMRACELECYMRSPGPDLKTLLDAYERETRAQAAIRAKQEQEASHTTGDEPVPGNSISWNELHASTPYPDSAD